tara:strand:- start:255 stop:458 length:204 start_codon:yes stop_codon:yes gene_type:complete
MSCLGRRNVLFLNQHKELTMTYVNATTPAETTAINISMLDIVTTALKAKGRLPCPRPMLGLPGNIES